MKKIITAIIFLTFPGIFISCSENSIVPPDHTDYTEWTLIDSNGTGTILETSLADENTIYCIKNNAAIKIQNGIESPVDLQDADFRPNSVHAYSGNYIIYRGSALNNTTRKIKIIKNNIVSSPSFIPQGGYYRDFIILEQDKFALGVDSMIYVYDHDTVKSTSIVWNQQRVIKRFFYSGGKLFILAESLGYSEYNYIYKYENGRVTFLRQDEKNLPSYFSGNNYLKIFPGYTTSSLNYFGESGWKGIFSAPPKNYLLFVTEGPGYVYMIASDSSFSPFKAYVWNGSKLFNETDQPTLRSDFTDSRYTNMKNNTFYFIGYKNNKRYLYKGKRI